MGLCGTECGIGEKTLFSLAQFVDTLSWFLIYFMCFERYDRLNKLPAPALTEKG
jgi:hypothetical protein